MGNSKKSVQMCNFRGCEWGKRLSCVKWLQIPWNSAWDCWMIDKSFPLAHKWLNRNRFAIVFIKTSFVELAIATLQKISSSNISFSCNSHRTATWAQSFRICLRSFYATASVPSMTSSWQWFFCYKRIKEDLDLTWKFARTLAGVSFESFEAKNVADGQNFSGIASVNWKKTLCCHISCIQRKTWMEWT